MQLGNAKRAILRSQTGTEVEFSSVEIEKPTYTSDVTLHPVERGQDVSDHVRPDPNEISLQGVIVGDDAADKLARLLEFRKNGEVLHYIGRNSVVSVVIKGLTPEQHVRIANGFYFTLSLLQVRIAESLMRKIKMPEARPASDAGMQQPQSKTSGTGTTSSTTGSTAKKLLIPPPEPPKADIVPFKNDPVPNYANLYSIIGEPVLPKYMIPSMDHYFQATSTKTTAPVSPTLFSGGTLTGIGSYWSGGVTSYLTSQPSSGGGGR